MKEIIIVAFITGVLDMIIGVWLFDVMHFTHPIIQVLFVLGGANMGISISNLISEVGMYAMEKYK